jgi:concentrative nucleoside transporter, CNT family
MIMFNVISFIGIFVFVFLGWIFSKHHRVINWRVIGWGIGLQIAFGLFVFKVPAGTAFFLAINAVVVKVVEASAAGTQFLFGPLALPPGTQGSPGFILAFQSLPTIIFFSALMSLLYYWRIMPFMIRLFAGVFTRLMKISGAESLCTASNIFVGVESAFTIRPHLADMTESELCTVLTAGMATVASSVMALYVFMLREQMPTIAGHLVSASILSAPAAIVMSKIILPETGTPKTLGVSVHPEYTRESNMFEAIINGANSGVKAVVGVCALLLAVLGLIALADIILAACGGWINTLTGARVDWTLKGLLGYFFYPISFILGVPPSDAMSVAKIVGERLVATEVAGYRDLAAALTSAAITPRSGIITAYALCGFAHFASMAIFIGGFGALAPSRIRDFSRVGIRALVAATLACLMTACIAGMLYSDQALLFGR